MPSTAAHARGADLLIHDAYNGLWLAEIASENPDQAIQVTNPAKYHTTTLEAAKIAQEAQSTASCLDPPHSCASSDCRS